ncbi:hypothetical protein SODALDRAFT_377155 [Sodiomyces alkalinus F11]|uniref:Nuclear pore complex protein Nup85 n=1 Tax=Sodiomyces alkalinus (strain CBS 110278 / VKM F-3762 / F11) TaxID=1314773 RepID=A0A3N2Q443_SODAK|nr:hypothetical protein SODALDRAFT_377155 [Sodiomyces alkalinus F11]ROT41486.1 hypothetical protein SODALDRAFT_377155 [Sodiomyces alkalinus F11]
MPTYGLPSDDSQPPSTPDRNLRYGSGSFRYDDNPSTTPAGPPPPSSAASFTPAGAPSESYLGSSVMRPFTAHKTANPGAPSAGSTNRNLFGRPQSSPKFPLANSMAAARSARQPSSLSREYGASKQSQSHGLQSSTFHIPTFDDSDEDEDEEEEPDEVAEADEEMKRYLEADIDEPEDESVDADEDEDMFLSMRHEKAGAGAGAGDQYNEPVFAGAAIYDEDTGQEANKDAGAAGNAMDEDFDFSFDNPDDSDPDFMQLVTPAATEKMRKEAEDIFRASTRRRSSLSGRALKFASTARDLYTELGSALITESPSVLLQTEELINQLYDEGIGTEEDSDKLDSWLSQIADNLTDTWRQYASSLPMPEGEHIAEVGPSPEDEPFRKASYVANLVLRLHHTRTGDPQTDALPRILFEWAQKNHDLYPGQASDVLSHRPCPAAHPLYWQTISSSLMRGNIAGAVQLLTDAGWGAVRKGPRGELAYTGKALENVQRAVDITIDMLKACPGNRHKENWDVFNSDWTLFRIQAKGSLDRLQRFAEGRGQDRPQFAMGGDYDYDNGGGASGRPSLASLARKAESQVPWDIYEHLHMTYEVAMGVPEAILDAAQDWCEATIGLFGWWDVDQTGDRDKSFRMSRSHGLQALALPAPSTGSDVWLDRLTTALHTAVASQFEPNPRNSVEMAIVSAFEGNNTAVIGFLRAWSLPVAAAVAELASLGQWLPKPESPNLISLESLDQEDLAILGMPARGKDEVEGVKDTTLVQYARELAGIDQLSPQRYGWEVAMEVLGRMDSAERSEEMVGELLRDILDALNVDSSDTVEKLWKILNELGMIAYAEDTAENFAEILARDSHRYGEALWYYALAHRPGKVREVLNLLTSYSLMQSAVFPPREDLDDHLHRLLTERSKTLEQYAQQDLEAAQLLGRMLSGYATLRKFYEIRDTPGLASMSSHKAAALRRQAATAIVAVISSSDDNIRGGLYDERRDAVVSEDFLLALLGEALAFVNSGSEVVITLDQMDALLKAVEDIETVSSTVFDAADEFFNLVLASAQGLKESTPYDLMRRKNTNTNTNTNTSASNLSVSSSHMLSGSTMLASQLHRSVSGGLSRTGGSAKRGWDWRSGLTAGAATSRDVLRMLRLGLSKDLSKLWLAEADTAPVVG